MMARPVSVLVPGRPELSGANDQFPRPPLGGGQRVTRRSPPSQLRHQLDTALFKIEG
jgi:hypothetical protein